MMHAYKAPQSNASSQTASADSSDVFPSVDPVERGDRNVMCLVYPDGSVMTLQPQQNDA